MAFWGNLLGTGRPAAVPAHAPAPDQDRDLVLFKFDTCPYCVRVFRAADSLGLEIPMRDTKRDPSAREALIGHTGRTQVPCLVIDGQPLLESADIVAWLMAYASRGES